MIDFKKVSIKDYSKLKKYFNIYQSRVSELTFTNIFAWREKYNFKYAIINDFLFILNETEKGDIYFSPPIGDYKKDYQGAIELLKDYCDEKNIKCIIKKLSEEKKDLIIKNEKFKYEIWNKRDQSDYLYNFDDLLNLSGNKYHKKKNRVNKFLKTYSNWSIETIDENNINECRKFLDNWCKENNCEKISGLKYEKIAINEVFDNYNKLDCFGIILKIDDIIAGFTVGEKLNDTTLVIHFEKGSTNYKSVYNMLSNQFLKTIDYDYKYINREQDLGIKGLRRSKMSYHPIELIDKYSILISDSDV